jgi:hypothetical protein
MGIYTKDLSSSQGIIKTIALKEKTQRVNLFSLGIQINKAGARYCLPQRKEVRINCLTLIVHSQLWETHGAKKTTNKKIIQIIHHLLKNLKILPIKATKTSGWHQTLV